MEERSNAAFVMMQKRVWVVTYCSHICDVGWAAFTYVNEHHSLPKCVCVCIYFFKSIHSKQITDLAVSSDEYTWLVYDKRCTLQHATENRGTMVQLYAGIFLQHSM